jgi:hypothetical protein
MKTPEEMGLSNDLIFTPQALGYWRQFATEDFIIEIMCCFRDEMLIIDGYIDTLQIEGGTGDLEQMCKTTLARIKRVNDILALASLYSASLAHSIAKEP